MQIIQDKKDKQTKMLLASPKVGLRNVITL